MEAVVLHRLRFLDYFCPDKGQDFKPSAAPIYPNMGKVHPPPPHPRFQYESYQRAAYPVTARVLWWPGMIALELDF